LDLQVIEGIVNVGQRLGVDYRLSTPISSILLSPDGKTAKGVTLPSGETVEADIVLVNADLVYAYNNLLPKSSYAKTLNKKPASCSSLSFYWAMDRVIPELSAHNIFLAEHYQESFDDIFEKHTMPAEPSFYVNVPSRIDRTAAPEGKDAIVVLLPIGHLVDKDGDGKEDELNQKEQDWEKIISKARKVVIQTMEKRLGIKGFEACIVSESMHTPMSCK